ncbi:DnaB-like helicase C-terminal domain-containing protein [Methylobacillus sp.]|uniref:DnaB-like helicase C-terminal domain-containing protein n=1 Tax=Methylobacillus sp. TaxID=56818 RepID=UPI0012BDBC9A|nr:DnaB-like helicase C-terminal domain-containing protein [Methylobacillus sp.]MPS48568.1 DNA helicase [Methylobacillus sp.]
MTTAASTGAAVVTPSIPASVPVAPATTGGYEFDAAFQAKIVALCIRDTNFMQRVEGLINPEYIESKPLAILVDMANRYFGKYRKSPSDKVVLAALIKHDVIEKKIRKEDMPVLVAVIQELWKVDISDRDYVIDQVATFARYQAVSKAILNSVGKLDMRSFEEIRKEMSQALDVGEHGDSGAYNYAEMIDVRTEERLDRAAGKLPPTGITTGYAEIDKVLYHKGWGRRELSVIMGGAKAGKTTALLDFGISACGHINKYNILYVTLEVSAKIISDRLDARISSQIIGELGNHSFDVKDKVKAFMNRSGQFIIHEFPSGSMKVSDLRRLIERYKAKGLKFDMIVLDYADLMAPERFTDNSVENSKSVYVSLRGLAMEEDIAILTATQTNREGAKKTVAQATDVAEDFNKVRIADILISINKSEEERNLNQARLFFAACRNQRSGFTIRINQDLSRMRFVAGVVGEE